MHKGAEWGIKQKKKNHKREAAINESGVNDVSFFLFFFFYPPADLRVEGFLAEER